MTPHPDLCFRPRAPVGRNRPTLTHPVLGTLELVNRDGVWWQGTAVIAGANVRLDVQQGAHPNPADVDAAGQLMQWIQTNEPAIRAELKARLARGGVSRFGLRSTSVTAPLEDVSLVDRLQPNMLVLWSEREADLFYVCDDVPEGHLLGCHQVDVDLDTRMRITPTLRELDLAKRSEHILQRPVPADAVDFVDSIADQFIARTAQWGSVLFTTDLSDLLADAIRNVESRIERGSPECAVYMTSIRRVLQALSDINKQRSGVAPDAFEILGVTNWLAFVHPAAKRMPIRTKLKSLDDHFRYDGTSMRVWFPPTTIRNFIAELNPLFHNDAEREREPKVPFEEVFPKNVQGITKWLAVQAPSAFAELRQAGFAIELIFNVSAKPTPASIDLGLPADLLDACSRLEITLKSQVAPHVW